MRTTTLAVTAALLFCLAACGKPVPPEQPIDTNVAPPTTSRPQPTGPSRVAEFRDASQAAHSAWRAYGDDPSAENYARAGAHIHRALAYAMQHERGGHNLASLRGRTELNRLRQDWSRSPPHGDRSWENDGDYQAARRMYLDAQQS